MNVLREVTVVCALAIASGCAHAGAGSEADAQAAVAEGIRAALKLYLPVNQSLTGVVCVEVAAPADFERGVADVLGGTGLRAVAMADCAAAGNDVALLVKVESYEWMDWVAHAELQMHGTVETRPDERQNFRMSWWRATFRVGLAFQQGHWAVVSADDLGRI